MAHRDDRATYKLDFRDVAGAFDIAEGNPPQSYKVLLDFGVAA